MEPTEIEKNTPETETGAVDIKRKSSFWEFIRFAIIAALIIIPFRIYIAQPFIVSGTSMIPTFHNGEYLIVDELSYRFQEPARGEIVIFRLPLDQNKFLIKRIIGLPSETVEIYGTYVIIRNEKNSNGIRLEEPYLTNAMNGSAKVVVLGENEYFVMGDNRGASADSRSWGKLSRTFIVGRALFRLFPPKTFGLFPGSHSFDEGSEKVGQ